VVGVADAGWWIVDHVLGEGQARIEAFWHFDPQWTLGLDGTTAYARCGTRVHALAASEACQLVSPGSDPLAYVSPAYGRLEPAPVVVSRTARALPATIATFIVAARASGPVRVTAIPLARHPGDAWHGAAFRAEWDDGWALLLSAVERAGAGSGEHAAPPSPWGSADTTTDARMALAQEIDGELEVYAVNGTFITLNGSRLPVNTAARAGIGLLTPPAARDAQAPVTIVH
jgi:hypothetical protein